MSVQEKAKEIVEDREKIRGHPLENWTRTADLWTILLKDKLKEGSSITAEEAILLMIGMKLVRESYYPLADNRIDIEGYTICLDRVIEARMKKRVNEFIPKTLPVYENK